MNTHEKLLSMADEYEFIDVELVTKLYKLCEEDTTTAIEYYFPDHPFDDSWLDAKIDYVTKCQIGLYKVRRYLKDKDK